MKRTLLISLIAGLVLLFTALPTFAQDVSFSGTITPGTALTGGVPESNGLSCATLTGGTRYFVVEEFQVPVSGKWSYIDTSYIRYRELSDGSLDLAVAFYTGSATTFDPNNPSGNGCFASFDDAGTMDLIAGVTYSVVVSTHFAGESGNYDFSLTQPLSTTISATDTAVAAFPNDDDYL